MGDLIIVATNLKIKNNMLEACSRNALILKINEKEDSIPSHLNIQLKNIYF